MKTAYCAIASALALAACNKSPQVSATNASVGEVAQKVRESGAANANFMHAGEWRVTSILDDVSMPGLPPAAQAQMEQMRGQAHQSNFEYCLTPEEAAHPGGKFFTGKEANNCRYDHFIMGGGKIDAAMHCDSAGGPGKMSMAMSGTYSPESYAMQATMNMDGGAEGRMSMTMHSEAKRIGECSPKEG